MAEAAGKYLQDFSAAHASRSTSGADGADGRAAACPDCGAGDDTHAGYGADPGCGFRCYR